MAMSQFDATNGVIDVLLPFGRVRGDEILMDGKADQVDAVEEGVAFEFLQVSGFFAVHLAVEDIDSFDASSLALSMTVSMETLGGRKCQ